MKGNVLPGCMRESECDLFVSSNDPKMYASGFPTGCVKSRRCPTDIVTLGTKPTDIVVVTLGTRPTDNVTLGTMSTTEQVPTSRIIVVGDIVVSERASPDEITDISDVTDKWVVQFVFDFDYSTIDPSAFARAVLEAIFLNKGTQGPYFLTPDTVETTDVFAGSVVVVITFNEGVDASALEGAELDVQYDNAIVSSSSSTACGKNGVACGSFFAASGDEDTTSNTTTIVLAIVGAIVLLAFVVVVVVMIQRRGDKSSRGKHNNGRRTGEINPIYQTGPHDAIKIGEETMNIAYDPNNYRRSIPLYASPDTDYAEPVFNMQTPC